MAAHEGGHSGEANESRLSSEDGKRGKGLQRKRDPWRVDLDISNNEIPPTEYSNNEERRAERRQSPLGRLRWISPEQRQGRATLNAGRTRIGRDRENDIVLDIEGVSGVHLVISRDATGFYRFKANEECDVLVKGFVTQEMRLGHGDRFEVSGVRFLFEV